MLIFIDESGDPGFKTDMGSSQTFVIACVCFAQNEHAEKASQAIKNLRNALGWSPLSEFRFSKLKKEIRLRFLQTVAPLDFKAHAIVFQKKNIYSPNLRNNKSRFYNFATKKVLESLGSQINQANIKIDGNGDKQFKRELECYLRQNLADKFRKLAFVDSKRNDLIQLADMCAGSISRSFTGKEDGKTYYRIIQRNIANVWDFK